MSKSALCVKKADVWAAGISLDKTKPYVYPMNDGLYGLQASMISREICETEPQLLQLIPYIVINDSSGKILTYVRGNATGEERLKAKLSIGFGGHIDRTPALGETLRELMLNEAVREIQEETGITIAPGHLQINGLIYEEETEVGKVHLGVLMSCGVIEETKEIVEEEGHIKDSEWITFDSLMSPEKFARLEGWSQAVVNRIATSIVNRALQGKD